MWTPNETPANFHRLDRATLREDLRSLSRQFRRICFTGSWLELTWRLVEHSLGSTIGGPDGGPYTALDRALGLHNHHGEEPEGLRADRISRIVNSEPPGSAVCTDWVTSTGEVRRSESSTWILSFADYGNAVLTLHEHYRLITSELDDVRASLGYTIPARYDVALSSGYPASASEQDRGRNGGDDAAVPPSTRR